MSKEKDNLEERMAELEAELKTRTPARMAEITAENQAIKEKKARGRAKAEGPIAVVGGIIVIGVVLAILAGVGWCAWAIATDATETVGEDNAEVITSGDYGPAWPFRPSKVTLLCEPGIYYSGEHLSRIYVEVDGRKYAVNGTARGLLDGKTYNSELDIHDFYSISNRSGNITQVIGDGLKLCE